MNITTVLIGIQARSTSSRFPGKCFEMIGDRMLLDHVVEAARSSANYMNHNTFKSGILVKVALLIPVGDRIEKEFGGCQIIQGPEHDVLARYKVASDKIQADYICRVTGDCPLIPPFVISKHIKIANINKYDYLGNGDEKYRTIIDGIDCEVISKRLLDHMAEMAVRPEDREHVTTYVRRNHIPWVKKGFTASHIDLSHIKLSVDTKEDLERVREEYDKRQTKNEGAKKDYGRSSVHLI